MPGTKAKVVVAMSGGVDSSVAAALLLREGYDVTGVFMRLGTPDGVELTEKGGHKQGCCSVLDAADARRVAGMLGIPFYVLNFQEEFGRVIDYFVGEYNRGRTPNPCVRCNDWLKFGKLAQYAKAVGADYVASGHYARLGQDPVSGNPALFRGKDLSKDQSYVLFGITREALAHTLLPIGAMEKTAVRALAQELNLPVFNKPDSQEICFVPDQDYAGLLKRRSPESMKAGELVADGKVVGHHEGHQHFTIGQRKGLGLAMGKPVYVVNIDARSNQVTLGERTALLRKGLTAGGVNWLADHVAVGVAAGVGAGGPEAGGVACTAKIRYNADPEPGRVWRLEDGTIRVEFDQPQSAITPGQAVVVYDGEQVLGGGWIEEAFE